MIYRGLFLFALIAFIGTPAHAGMIDYPIVKMQALDKSTARTVTFEAKVGTTVEYGSLFIKVQSCRKSEPLDKPESASFLQIWEVPLNSEKSEWAFSGWMFASSPALSAMDHPVYDVWVLDCLTKSNKGQKAKVSEAVDDLADGGALEGAVEEAVDAVDSEASPAQENEAPAETQEQTSAENITGGIEAIEEESSDGGSDAFVIPNLNVPAVP